MKASEMNVSTRKLGELACVVLALYIAAIGLLSFSFFIFGVMNDFSQLRQGGPFLAYFAVAAIFWFGRVSIAERFFPNEEETAIPLRTATIAVRVIGLLMVPRFIQALGSVLSPPSRVGPMEVALWWIPAIVAGTIIAFFIFGGDRLVAHLTSALPQEEAARTPAVVFGAVGLYMMVTAIPNLARIWIGIRMKYYGPPYEWRPRAGEIVAHSLILLLGIALFLGSSGLARAWHTVRSMPPPPPPGRRDDAQE